MIRERLPEWAQWLRWIPEPEHGKVLTMMRALRAESERHLAAARELMPRHGEIALGAGDFDEWLIGEAYATFLGAINDGYYPLLAAANAKEFIRDAVKIHNRKRPRDTTWQRWDETASNRIDRLQREFSRLVGECPECNAVVQGKACANCGAPAWARRPA